MWAGFLMDVHTRRKKELNLDRHVDVRFNSPKKAKEMPHGHLDILTINFNKLGFCHQENTSKGGKKCANNEKLVSTSLQEFTYMRRNKRLSTA
jgi:hypothetical protein